MKNVRNATMIAAALGFAVAGCSAHGSMKMGDTTPKAEKAPPPPPAPKVAAPKPKRPRRAHMNTVVKRVEIDDKVMFASGKAELLPESNALLDDVADVLQENPDAKQVEVAGHTDSTGSAEMNRKLSQDRAEAVRAYLVSKGVAADRLVAKGYGPDEPIADNNTDDGKEKNRRVEFRVGAPAPAPTVAPPGAAAATTKAGEPAAAAPGEAAEAKGKAKAKGKAAKAKAAAPGEAGTTKK
jgi:outer membrane protein OmpA-like peptidoglycan-associated protein